MTDILDAPEFTDVAQVRTQIRGSRLLASLDSWAADDTHPAETTLTFSWPGIDDLEVPLDQADDAVTKLREWVDGIAAAVRRAQMGGAQ